MSFEEYYRQLLAGERHAWTDRLLLHLLKLLSAGYGLAMHLRSRAYGCGLLRAKRLPLPVISVGNITSGGTGKTPAVLMIARHLMARGKRVCVLTRGYGGSLEGEVRIVSDGTALLLSVKEAGDEPCLLASSLPGLMVVMGSDRYRAGCLAMQRLNPDCFIMDDGFQHQRLARDLDILLLDAADPAGNGRLLPAGLLREPVAAARRAHLVIMTRCSGAEQTPGFLSPVVPICRSSHDLTGYTALSATDVRPFADLAGRRVVAFCGIAGPAGFFDGLEARGVALVATLAFPDHCPYGRLEMESLGRLKQQYRADCLITTAKDAVKLIPYAEILGDCYVARMELTLHGPEPLFGMLDKTV